MSGMTAEEREQFVREHEAKLATMTEGEAYARWRAARVAADLAFASVVVLLPGKSERDLEHDRLLCAQSLRVALSDMESVVRRVEKEKRR
jgi:hypothetical protein